uniref:peptide-methionine (S)-S-oxide reductase n=1 Tax=Hippocampus comes TaxID=109280 RepID=A0A3Q2ZGW5_HIPCM
MNGTLPTENFEVTQLTSRLLNTKSKSSPVFRKCHQASPKSVKTGDRSQVGSRECPTIFKHAVNQNTTVEPFPEGMGTIMFGMGCFWGAEKFFWKVSGVFSTQVGFAGGFTPNPTYEEVCTGMTGHTEVVRVVFSPKDLSVEELLKLFWENHDPTQGMKQHADIGTQYRSAIYTSSAAQQELALNSKVAYQKVCGQYKLSPFLCIALIRLPLNRLWHQPHKGPVEPLLESFVTER